MQNLYLHASESASKVVTNLYSTSFSLGIKVFDKKLRMPIYSIYGFVRLADEIVDTFYDFDQAELLERFRKDTYQAIEEGISMNPILHSFQHVVNKYGIDNDLIEAFLVSMSMDLSKVEYGEQGYKDYIYGSAEVVGLMCLKVFCEDNRKEYERLRPFACSLGAAFQKINFLRDMKSDFEERGRVYFPTVDYLTFTQSDKLEIEKDIKKDFDNALIGIKQLPRGARLGVYLAYIYYTTLFKKIVRADCKAVKSERIRVKDSFKLFLLCKSALQEKMNLI